jgi:hypothetical protein
VAKKHDEAQEALDREDAVLRLEQLRRALIEQTAAAQLVRSCQDQLRRAKSALRRAVERVQELAFLEKHRTNGQK